MTNTVRETISLQEWEDIAALLGKETAASLVEHLGGQSIYVPKSGCSGREFRNYNIFYAYNGHNIRELAYKYQLSDRQVRRIIQSLADKGKRR